MAIPIVHTLLSVFVHKHFIQILEYTLIGNLDQFQSKFKLLGKILMQILFEQLMNNHKKILTILSALLFISI